MLKFRSHVAFRVYLICASCSPLVFSCHISWLSDVPRDCFSANPGAEVQGKGWSAVEVIGRSCMTSGSDCTCIPCIYMGLGPFLPGGSSVMRGYRDMYILYSEVYFVPQIQ